METAKLVLEFFKVLVWPAFALACVLLFRGAIRGLIPRIKNAEFPGGMKVDFGETLAEAEKLKESILSEPKKQKPAVPAPHTFAPAKQTSANQRMLALGLQPSPSGLDIGYYRALLSQDPNLALAGVRMELEILGRNLARGFHVGLPENIGAKALFRKLLDAGAITNLQYQLLEKIIVLCNAAVHGQKVTREQAESILELMKFLADDYVQWLSWGFPGR